MKKKVLALVLAMVLVVVGVAAGTLAWLTAKSDTVTNTFTTSDIKVELKETKNNFILPADIADDDKMFFGGKIALGAFCADAEPAASAFAKAKEV